MEDDTEAGLPVWRYASIAAIQGSGLLPMRAGLTGIATCVIGLCLSGETQAATGVDAFPKARAQETDGAEADARMREEEAEEDPLTQRQQRIQREAETRPIDRPSDEPSALSVYGSLRVRYRTTLGRRGIEDGSSRVGLQGSYQLMPQKQSAASEQPPASVLPGLSLVEAYARWVSPDKRGAVANALIPKGWRLESEGRSLFSCSSTLSGASSNDRTA